MILAEFGRTTGALNNQAGRDHFLRMSMVFAGGGTRGGSVLGKTDSAGNDVVDYGWSANRDVRPSSSATLSSPTTRDEWVIWYAWYGSAT